MSNAPSSCGPRFRTRADLCGLRQIDIVQYAAVQSQLAGRVERALEFLGTAEVLCDAREDPVTAALVHERSARCLQVLGRPADEILHHVERAVALVPESEAAARARVLATRGQQLMLMSRSADAVAPCEEAIALAQRVSDLAIESHARNSLGTSIAVLGDCEQGLEQLRIARDQALRASSWDDVARADGNEVSVLAAAARHEEALAVALAGLEFAANHGLSRHSGSHQLPAVCEALWQLGRWSEMDGYLHQIDMLNVTGLDAWMAAQLGAERAAGRGDFDTAHTQLDFLRRLLGPRVEVPWQIELANLEVEIALWEGDLVTAFAAGRRGMAIESEGPLCADSPSASALPLNAMAAATERILRPTRATAMRSLTRASTRVTSRHAIARLGARRTMGQRTAGRPRAHRAAGRSRARARRRTAATPRSGPSSPTTGARSGCCPGSFTRSGAKPDCDSLPAIAPACTRSPQRPDTGWPRRSAGAGSVTVWWISLAGAASRSCRSLPESRTRPARSGSPRARSRCSASSPTVARIDRSRKRCSSRPRPLSAHVSNVLAKLGVTNRAEAGAAARRLDLD